MKTATLTIKALQQAFAVSHMTIRHWREGTPSKEPLPTVDTGTRYVGFKPADIKRWAKAHKIEIVDPSALVPGAVEEAKSGPKATKKAKPVGVVKKSALRIKQATKKPARKRATVH